MTDGIYTLANDVVFDQLVALLNSIEANAGKDVPVCVIAFDDNLEQVRAEVDCRENVTLLDDKALFARWEEFSLKVWQSHPHALKTWQEQGIQGVRRLGMNRRYCAFDADSRFERFIYLDADTLVLNSLDKIFQHLDEHPFIVYDYQYKDPSHIYSVNSPKLLEVFDQQRIESEIFCAGFYASKRGLFFDAEQRDKLILALNQGDAEVLYMGAPNQSVLNYMTMKSEIPVYNLALQWPKTQTSGNSVTSSHFEERDHVLYDQGVRLTYLHYIGLSSKFFSRASAGENIGFPYRDLFLHYRYLHAPDQRPVFVGKPKSVDAPPSLPERIMRKIGLVH